MSSHIKNGRAELIRLATDVVRLWASNHPTFTATGVSLSDIEYHLDIVKQEGDGSENAKEKKTVNTQALEEVNVRIEKAIRQLKHYIAGYYIDDKDINARYRAFGLSSELIKERKKKLPATTITPAATTTTTTTPPSTNTSSPSTNTTPPADTTTTTPTSITAANTSTTNTTDNNPATPTANTTKKYKRREYTPYGLPHDNDKRQRGVASVIRILTDAQNTTPDFPNVLPLWQNLLAAHQNEWLDSRDLKAERSNHSNNATVAETALTELLRLLRANIKLAFFKQDTNRILRTFGFFKEI